MHFETKIGQKIPVIATQTSQDKIENQNDHECSPKEN